MWGASLQDTAVRATTEPDPVGLVFPAMSTTTTARATHFFTVDVEEHFHVSAFERLVDPATWDSLESRVDRNVNVLLELLARHDTVGTFFTVGWVARKSPALVRRIADAGHEVASHTFWHRKVSSLTPEEFRARYRECGSSTLRRHRVRCLPD